MQDHLLPFVEAMDDLGLETRPLADFDRTTLCLAYVINENRPLIAIAEQSGQG